MANELFLASPLMRGPEVRALQLLLGDTNNTSKFGNFRPGSVDGVFGESTAGAVRRAKHWLGYKNPDNVAGPRLVEYLSGKRSLNLGMKARRAARLRKHADRPLRLKAFDKAKAQLGVKESPPGSNRVFFTAWYGMIGAWCAMFVTWCYVMAGSKRTFQKGVRYAYTPFMVRDARLGVNGMALIKSGEIKRGHIVMFDWQLLGQGENPYYTDHVGLFDEWISKEAGTFRTIEGNTAVGADSDGGQVMYRDRNLRQVSAIIQAEV